VAAQEGTGDWRVRSGGAHLGRCGMRPGLEHWPKVRGVIERNFWLPLLRDRKYFLELRNNLCGSKQGMHPAAVVCHVGVGGDDCRLCGQ